ncbi:MAG: quinone-dependent dihydroorotate dehydrogenase [Propionibacteriaceae bacterium]|jgi:dihydroorotate dehydrogenase|nr:quinone-dependent dihydroorotate dehydrogenase [Propionibacteriaceae bacterium]
MRLRVKLVSGGYTRLLRPVLFRSHHGDPEAIHEQMIALLAAVGSNPLAQRALGLLIPRAGRAVNVAGIDFPNRVGLAAGMDKDGLAARAWAGLGFGFAELGTVTGRAQPGNDKPRVFRLPASKALINRMGFNNEGAAALAARLAALGVERGNGRLGIPIGISIGKTKAVPLADAVDDYLASLNAVAPHADYVAVNVSSPNTPGLRKLQDGRAVEELLGELCSRAGNLAVRYRGAPVPIFLKVAPDIEWPDLDGLLLAAENAGAAGFIATNTTLRRRGLKGRDAAKAGEDGGLSGRPLTRLAREVVGYITAHTALPVIASGGIMRPEDAMAMFDLGARLVQLYTGFVYSGPALAANINAWDLAREPLWDGGRRSSGRETSGPAASDPKEG